MPTKPKKKKWKYANAPIFICKEKLKNGDICNGKYLRARPGQDRCVSCINNNEGITQADMELATLRYKTGYKPFKDNG